jgi:hypothetical protein
MDLASMVICTVPQHESAAIQDAVPAHAEIVPVDFGLRLKAGACFGPLIEAILPTRCDPLTQAPGLQDDFPRGPANGELTLHEMIVLADNFLLIAGTSDGRIVLSLEKVGTPQMSAGPSIGTCIDLNLNTGLLRSSGIKDEPAMNILEMPANVAHHHLAHAKFAGQRRRCVVRRRWQVDR